MALFNKLLTYLLLVNHFANKGPYSQSYGFSSRHVQMWVLEHKEAELQKKKRRLNFKELMLSNCVAGEDSWESLGLQGD